MSKNDWINFVNLIDDSKEVICAEMVKYWLK